MKELTVAGGNIKQYRESLYCNPINHSLLTMRPFGDELVFKIAYVVPLIKAAFFIFPRMM